MERPRPLEDKGHIHPLFHLITETGNKESENWLLFPLPDPFYNLKISSDFRSRLPDCSGVSINK